MLHIFQFETKQGEDICMALQTHINDIMMKRYSKVAFIPSCFNQCPPPFSLHCLEPSNLEHGPHDLDVYCLNVCTHALQEIPKIKDC